jgi:hypothetical protein
LKRQRPVMSIRRYPYRYPARFGEILVDKLIERITSFYVAKSIWWGKKDSNLRSHKTADLQSAPFATRDTPPLNSIGTHPPKWRR